MPAKDAYHGAVKRALIKDGWIVTHDPYALKYGRRDAFIDLGAEELVAADKEGRKIAVEIKSFSGPSLMADLERALGQFMRYETLLEDAEPERLLYLAVDVPTYEQAFSEQSGEKLRKRNNLRLIIYDAEGETIRQWIL